MTLILYAMACAVGMAAGVFLIIRAIIGSPVPLSTVQTRLAGPGVPVSGAGATDRPFDQVLGEKVRARLVSLGRFETVQLARDLRIAKRTPEQHAYERLAWSGLGFIFPALYFALMAGAGAFSTPIPVVVGFMVALAVVGFLYPDRAIANEAAERRTEFRYGLSIFLDLVVMLMAGGSGPGEAVKTAAGSGEGWVFEELRAAGRRAELRSIQPWTELATLGRELGVNDMIEVAASLTMGGKHGTVQIQSLISRTDALRESLAAKTEAHAESQTEKMLLPLGLVLAAFVVFAGFGAFRSAGTLISDTDQPPPIDAGF